MTHPYVDLEQRAFWAPSVGSRDARDIEALWTPKFPIKRRQNIATFGSCFAQHFGRALKSNGYNWMDTEPLPAPIDDDTAKAFNYGVFTARTGNIYTVSLLNQWVRWALGEESPQAEIWEKDGRFYDPFRPAIEPDGFASHAEMLASRDLTIEAFRRAISDCNVFVFTLGLTESWWNEPGGYEYPMCPGTVAGTFDPALHNFRNQDYKTIENALHDTVRRIKSVNRKVRILLTVSPVPLTATLSGDHVLVATTYSKSVLRAVAGAYAQRPFVDYFPSYEVITSAPFGGQFFETNKRSVQQAGVNHVMGMFFGCMNATHKGIVPDDVLAAFSRDPASPAKPKRRKKSADDLICEEEMLAAFGSETGKS